MIKTIRHLELFSGVGGFRRAIDLFCDDNNLNSRCVGFSEIDKYALRSYEANFDSNKEIKIGDIDLFTKKKKLVQSLPDFDLLTAGFPCQAFSMMGKKLGFHDTRGNIFYTIIKVLQIKQPKYVLLENVRNLKKHAQGSTFMEINRSLQEDAGYSVFDDVFNTSDFGLPQTRRRVFILAIRNDLTDLINQINFSQDEVIKYFNHLNGHTSLRRFKNVLDGVLEKNVSEKYYLSQKIKPTILADGSKKFKSKSEINQLIARPLTATMVKMHRACQDNYYSDEFLAHQDPYKYLSKNFSKEEEAKHRIRKLTPLEAFRLQGFDDDYFKKATAAEVSNHQLYKQAGNAVSVNTAYAILNYLFRTIKL